MEEIGIDYLKGTLRERNGESKRGRKGSSRERVWVLNVFVAIEVLLLLSLSS